MISHPYEMQMNEDDVRRVLKQVHHDMSIDRQAIRYALHLIDDTKNTRPFPGELESHAQYEENRLNTTDQDALDKIRQEYLLAEILELSSNSAVDHRRHSIIVRDIINAIRLDDELLTLFRPYISGCAIQT